MIFGIKLKSVIWTHTNVLLAFATNIPVLLMTVLVLQGHIWVIGGPQRGPFKSTRGNAFFFILNNKDIVDEFAERKAQIIKVITNF